MASTSVHPLQTPLWTRWAQGNQYPHDDALSVGSSSRDDTDMRSDYYDSDVEKAPSVYSYASSRDGHMLRDLHGRTVNTHNSLYALPADEEEYQRIDTQHRLLKLAIGSLCAADHLVKRALAPDGYSKKALLDVGTGAGAWATEVALEYPHVDVLGIDLAPVFRPAPPNCRFELDDVTLGMSHYRNSFNVVHSRSIGTGISDYPAYISDILDTLRPGGVILLVEGDLQLRLPNKEPVDPQRSAMQKLLFEAYNTLKSKGSSVDSGSFLGRWLQNDPKCKNVHYRQLYCPIGPWMRGHDEQTQRQNLIGELMRIDSKAFVRSLRPALLDEGYFPESINRLIADTDRELDQLSLHLFTVWHYAWAEKA